MNDDNSSSTRREWTLMIYLAGDNNLESYSLKDLAEMCSVGSSSEVAIVAQLDRMADKNTRRYFIAAGRDPQANWSSTSSRR